MFLLNAFFFSFGVYLRFIKNTLNVISSKVKDKNNIELGDPWLILRKKTYAFYRFQK